MRSDPERKGIHLDAPPGRGSCKADATQPQPLASINKALRHRGDQVPIFKQKESRSLDLSSSFPCEISLLLPSFLYLRIFLSSDFEFIFSQNLHARIFLRSALAVCQTSPVWVSSVVWPLDRGKHPFLSTLFAFCRVNRSTGVISGKLPLSLALPHFHCRLLHAANSRSRTGFSRFAFSARPLSVSLWASARIDTHRAERELTA